MDVVGAFVITLVGTAIITLFIAGLMFAPWLLLFTLILLLLVFLLWPVHRQEELSLVRTATIKSNCASNSQTCPLATSTETLSCPLDRKIETEVVPFLERSKSEPVPVLQPYRLTYRGAKCQLTTQKNLSSESVSLVEYECSYRGRSWKIAMLREQPCQDVTLRTASEDNLPAGEGPSDI
jgi:hypothetical protein